MKLLLEQPVYDLLECDVGFTQIQIHQSLHPLCDISTPFMKFRGIFKKKFKHFNDGFIFKNAAGKIVATTNIGWAGDKWEIAMVAVLTGYRRRGLGKRLIDKAIEHARDNGAERIVLEVISDNTPAYNLYLQKGFVHYDSEIKYEHSHLSDIPDGIIPKEFELKDLKYNKKVGNERYDLQKRATPVEVQEIFPTDKKNFHKGLIIKILRPVMKKALKLKLGTLLVYKDDKLVASLLTVLGKANNDAHQIELVIDPEYEQDLTRPLLSKALKHLKENTKHDIKALMQIRNSNKQLLETVENFGFEKYEEDHLMALKIE